MASDYVTIRVPEDVHQEAKERKNDAGQTWSEYLTDSNRGSADPESVAEELSVKIDVDADDAKSDLEEIKQIAKDAAESTDALKRESSRGNTGVNEAELAEYLADYLINGENLPEKVASELR